MDKPKDTEKLEYRYGKTSESIIANLFKLMKFEVYFTGVEHRKHYKNQLTARDIYAPDLKLYDPETEETFFVEVKAPLIYKDKIIVIDKELLHTYYQHYKENSFLLIYIPPKNSVGMTMIKEIMQAKWLLNKSVRLIRYYDKKKKRKVTKEVYALPFSAFRQIAYYGREWIISNKFDIDKTKIMDFLDSQKDRIIPMSNELIRKHKLKKKKYKHSEVYSKKSSNKLRRELTN